MGSLFSSSQRTQSTGTTNTNTSNNLNNDPNYQNFLAGFSNQYQNAGNFNVGLNDAQRNSVTNQQGVATNPGLGQGFNAAGNIAQNGFAGGIDAFNNPYQNNVIGAMQTDFARQNAEAQDARNAGAARSGALGNNTGRDALMARGAQDAQANALTQARFQGWNTSANLANQDAQARLSGANTIGNLTGAATNANTALNNMGRSNWQSEYQNERTPYDLYNQGMQGYQGAGNLAGTTSTGNTTGNSNTTSTPSFMQSLMGVAGMGMSGYNWGQGNGWWRDGGAVKGKGYNDGGSVIPPFHANGAAESFADKVARAHETVSKLRASGGRTEKKEDSRVGEFANRGIEPLERMNAPMQPFDPWSATVRPTDAEENGQDPFWSPAQASRMVSWPPFRPMQYEMAELRGFDGGGMVLPPMMAPQGGPPARPGMQGAPPMGGQGMVMPPFQPQGPPAAPGSQGIPPMQQGAMPQRSAPQQGQFDPWSKGMPAGTQTPEHVASMLRGYDEGGSVLPEVMTPFPGFNQRNTTPMGPAFGGNPFAQFMPGMTPAPPAEPDVAGATLGPETTGQILPFGGNPSTSANIMEAYNPNGPPRSGTMVPTSGPGPVMDPNATTSDGGAGRRRGRTVSPNEEFAAMLLAASGPQVFGGAGEAALKNHQRRVSELNAELQADQLAQQLAHQNAQQAHQRDAHQLNREELAERIRHNTATEANRNTNRPETAYQVGMANAAVKDVTDRSAAIRNSTGQLERLGQMETLINDPNVRQGAWANWELEGKKAAQALGFNMQGVPESEALRALSNQIALQLRNPAGGEGMPGAMSDADRNFLVASVPGLTTTDAGNRALIRIMQDKENYRIRQNRAAIEYIQRNHTNDGLEQHMQRWAETNPMISRETRAATERAIQQTPHAPASAVTPPPQATAAQQPIGARRQLRDGSWVVKQANGQWLPEAAPSTGDVGPAP